MTDSNEKCDWNSKSINFFDTQKYSDVIIKFGGHQIFAHKVMLARRSVYLQRAFTGHFMVASSPVIDIGDEGDPQLVRAMVQHMYADGPGPGSDWYPESRNHDNPLDLLINLFILGEKYDIQSLRDAAAQYYRWTAEEELETLATDPSLESEFTLSIPKVCGPGAIAFADKSLQMLVLSLCVCYHGDLLRNKHFLDMFTDGTLFDSEFKDRFSLSIINTYLRSTEERSEEITAYLNNFSKESAPSEVTKAFDNPQLSDVVIKCGDLTLHAHKVILASHSSWFRSTSDTDNTSIVDLSGECNPVVVKTLIRYIYGWTYSDCWRDWQKNDALSFHLDAYLLGRKYGIARSLHGDLVEDFYDDTLLDSLDGAELPLCIARVCGPNSEFDGTNLQSGAFEVCVDEIDRLMKNETFTQMLQNGDLFSVKFAGRFAFEVGKARSGS